jgi:predicted nucleotide-binding protein (sugar kinase/HSP70/actin superfamily)
MPTRIGIPRAMMFYRYYPLWSTFLRELGVEVIISPPTSKRLLDRGIIHAPEDTCLPVKVAMGHVEWLRDKVDIIFIPRLVHMSPKYATCPKFLGLPDMMRADVDDLPPILDPTFDAKKESFARTFMKLGRNFTRNPFRIRKAYKRAIIEYDRFRKLVSNGVGVLEAMGLDERREAESPADASILIGVVGHPYNLYDRYTNLDLFRKLANMGARVVTPEMLPPSVVEEALASLERPPYWELAREIVGSALHFLNGHADGVIHLVSFECGPDSLLQYLLEFENRHRLGIPYVPLVMDEHTGEAGVVTRLEAFIDMIVRKPRSVTSDSLPATDHSLPITKR